MANIIDAETLRIASDLPDPLDMKDAIENEVTDYTIRNFGVAPRYLYMNNRVWELCADILEAWITAFNLEVIDSALIPPDTAFVNYNYYHHRDIAQYIARRFGSTELRDQALAAGELNM